MALLSWNFHSHTLGISASANVILPQAAVEKGEKLPVLCLLHGLSDDHTNWQRRTSIERYADPLGLAVVMPAVNRSFYANMAHGPRYWDFICEELPQLCAIFFPLSDKRADTFVAGLSMGGYGAFKVALSHPNRSGSGQPFWNRRRNSTNDKHPQGRPKPARRNRRHIGPPNQSRQRKRPLPLGR